MMNNVIVKNYAFDFDTTILHITIISIYYSLLNATSAVFSINILSCSLIFITESGDGINYDVIRTSESIQQDFTLNIEI